MSTDAERIAEDLLAAYARDRAAVTAAFEAALADQVTLAHEPVQPQDGVYDRATLVGAQTGQAERIAGVLQDYRENVSAAVVDDEIVLSMAISGRLADGTEVRISGTDVLTVTRGRVTRMLSAFESEQMEQLVAALMKGQGPVGHAQSG